MSKRYNLIFEQAATFQHTVNWKEPDGDPVDLTGYRIRLQVRQDPGASVKLVDFDSDDLDPGMTITPLGVSGSFTITFAPSVTLGLNFTSCEYDLTATSPGGVVYRLHEGKASVSPGVTR